MDENLLQKTYEEVAALKDLFLRRLMDDKVKSAAIVQLKEENELLQRKLDLKILSSFIKDLLLVCDRIEAQPELDGMTASVHEELLDLLARREIVPMEQSEMFDPRLHHAVGTELASEEYPDKSVIRTVRNGYLFRDKVFRSADVIVAVQTENPHKAENPVETEA